MVRLYINKDFRYTFLREFASMQEAVAYLTRLEMGKEPEIPENYDIVAWEDEQPGAQWTGEWGPFLHTPGPWEAIPAKNEHGEPTISIRGDGQFIATMDTVSIDGAEFSLPPEGAANARLIAAAPDLLAACKALLNFARSVRPGGGVLTGEEVMFRGAAAAIARATGNSQDAAAEVARYHVADAAAEAARYHVVDAAHAAGEQ